MTSRNPHAATYQATRQATRPQPEQARTAPAALSAGLKWAGVALLVIAVLLAVYVGAGLLGELVARAAYP